MGKIFISYRRSETPGEAGWLADELAREFGEDSVLIDVNAIEPGLDFRGKIQRQIGSCSVLLAVIGPNWAAPKEQDNGKKRKGRTDYVHLEISWALKRRLRIIPVLVQGAQMPSARVLPEELKRLATRNAVEMRHAHWKSDLQELVAVLRKLLGPAKVEALQEAPDETEDEAEIEPVPDYEPALELPAVEEPKRSHANVWGTILAIVAIVLYFYFTAGHC